MHTKKFLVLLVAVGLVTVGMSFGQQTQTFNLSATVQEYIEVNPAYKVVDKPMITIPGFGIGVLSTGWSNQTSYYDAIYANCRFSFTLKGDNDAGDGQPILAREETHLNVGGLGTWDRLQTLLVFNYLTNPGERHHVIFTSNAEGAVAGDWSPRSGSVSFKSAPHNGEVALEVFLGAALPHLSPDFDNPNTWNQSADAGLYTCYVTATYAII